MEWTITTFLLANFILILGSILQMATGVSMGMIVVPYFWGFYFDFSLNKS